MPSIATLAKQDGVEQEKTRRLIISPRAYSKEEPVFYYSEGRVVFAFSTETQQKDFSGT